MILCKRYSVIKTLKIENLVIDFLEVFSAQNIDQSSQILVTP